MKKYLQIKTTNERKQVLGQTRDSQVPSHGMKDEAFYNGHVLLTGQRPPSLLHRMLLVVPQWERHLHMPSLDWTLELRQQQEEKMIR